MQIVLKIVLGILIVIAGTLGFLIYKQKADTQRPVPVSGTKVDTKATTKTSTTTTTKTPQITVTGGVENAIKKIITAGVSQEERSAYVKYLETNAVSKTAISMVGCKPDANNISIKEGANLMFNNAGTSTIKIIINKENTFVLTPKASKTIVADFKFGPSVYGYSCDIPSNVVGIVVTK